MSIENFHQAALVCKVDVEVLCKPGNFQDDGATSVLLELWTEEVELAGHRVVFWAQFLRHPELGLHNVSRALGKPGLHGIQLRADDAPATAPGGRWCSAPFKSLRTLTRLCGLLRTRPPGC